MVYTAKSVEMVAGDAAKKTALVTHYVGILNYFRHNINGDDVMDEPPRPKKLLEQVQDVIALKHYSPRTGETYSHWIKRFILFHGKRHPKDMGAPEIEQFLTHRATKASVAASRKIRRSPRFYFFIAMCSSKTSRW